MLGHYGCGKTNFSLNMAYQAAKRGEKVTLVDMDIVNPYFRSSDYAAPLLEQGIRLVKPSLAGTTLDSPSLSAEIYAALQSDGCVIFDVGGDDAGAGALARFSDKLRQRADIEMLYVINRFRPQTATADAAYTILREIESACRLKATALVNNSHLCSLTTAQDIRTGYEYAVQTAAVTGLPLKCTTVPEELYEELAGTIPDLCKIKKYVRLPF